ncbi:hypothetical protein CR983_03840 [Candidatus Saccharibacteria bacterium]|nr:MAG: hypothetical protein CR983_03840 [Candidatus Saccharibacteria bacterium]
MNFAIYLQTLRTHYRSAFYVGIGLAVMALMFAALYENLKDQLEHFIYAIPAGFEAVLGELATATTPEGWLGIELFALFFPLALVILGIVYGSRVIGREEDSGTLELLLATSVGRLRLVIQKYFALIDLLAIPATVLFVSIALWTVMFPFKPDLWHVLGACVSGWLLGLVYGSISFAVHAITGRSGLAVAIGSAAFAATYTVFIISKLLESWQDYDVFSPFYYFNNPGTLIDGLAWERLAVLVALSLCGLLVALIGFHHRDTGIR